MSGRHARARRNRGWVLPALVGAAAAVAALIGGAAAWLLVPVGVGLTWFGMRQIEARERQALVQRGWAEQRTRQAEAGADSWRAEADHLSAALAELAAALEAERAATAAWVDWAAKQQAAQPPMATEIHLPESDLLHRRPTGDDLTPPVPAGWQEARVRRLDAAGDFRRRLRDSAA